MIDLQFKQRGRAELDFLSAISIGSTKVRNEAKQDIDQVVEKLSLDALPDDLDQRNELFEAELKHSNAFRVQQLIGEWHSQNHGIVAINAFDDIEPELRNELQQLEQGPATLHENPDFVAPDYWKGVEFHRTAGTWEGHQYMGLIHGEIIHRRMVAKFFTDGIFKQRLAVAALAPKDKYDRILELGCSSGHYTQALAETYPDSEITGVDLSVRMLQHSQRLANQHGWAWQLYQRPAEDTGFDDDTFDLVTSYIVLHELPASIVKAVFDEAFRVLKPGGDMLMSDVARYSELNKLDQWLADRGAMYSGEPHWRESASLDLKQVAEQAGFVDVKAEGMNGKPYPYLVSGEKTSVSKDNTSKNNKDPKSFNTPGRATLNDSDIGDVGMAVLTLAKEVWVLRDRLTILETVLAEKGIDVTEEIDRFQPDDALQKKLDEQANTMIETLLATIKGSE